MNVAMERRESRKKRQVRVRRKVKGSPDRPRLCVFRSAKHIYAQIIEDTTGTTLVAASTVVKEVGGDLILCNVPSSVQQVLKVLDLDTFFTTRRTRAEALALTAVHA